MKKKYKLPIMGKALETMPLKGDDNDPICVIPLNELPDCPIYFNTEVQEMLPERYRYTCLDYDIDEEWCEVELEASEEFHNWLTDMLPQLRGFQKAKGWKLDKTKMEKVKVV
jgi:hypothetical protein